MLKICEMVSHQLALLAENVNMKIFNTSERGKNRASRNTFIPVLALLMMKIEAVEFDAVGKLGTVETVGFAVIW